MSASDDRLTRPPSAEHANAAIRAFVRARGNRPWSRQELAELDRLRCQWRRAVRARITTAA